jgi:protease YdgD
MRCAAALLAALALPGAAFAQPPGMAAVGVLSIGGTSRCSATLIAPELVLTAGHCVLRSDRGGPVTPEAVAFRTGAYPGHPAAEFRAGDVVVHPLYIGADEDDATWLPNDAGLVRLSSPVPPEVAAPIGVTDAPIGDAPTFLASYRAGRGARARERRCPVLREWPEVVTFSCDVRPGESGSPILVSDDGLLGLVGIVSASTRTKRTETTVAARAGGVVGALIAFMGPVPSP